jgi:Mg-chelatase subunit ChlI
MDRSVYPFSAVVGQDALRAALLLNAVDPSVGGVLIRGQKGTGKSTIARGIAALMPPIEVVEGCPFNSDPLAPFVPPNSQDDQAVRSSPVRTLTRPTPFVELPLNATEDRLAGTLHLEKALQQGQRQFEPGLLAAANRGVLYVDEVNLLDDHLVDLLLDAAASGVNVVEREGLSFVHPARFLLVGTMNPEEGELRPQLLDRFGLCVTADRITEIEARETIVRRRLAFERDPGRFLAEWAEPERELAAHIRLARSRLAQVRLPDAWLTFVARLARELGVAGHRADLTVIKAAQAHAAWLEKNALEAEDVLTAARLAAPHRLGASPLDAPEHLQESILRAFERLSAEARGQVAPVPESAPPAPEDLEAMAEGMQIPGAHAAGSILFTHLKKKRSPSASSWPTNA